MAKKKNSLITKIIFYDILDSCISPKKVKRSGFANAWGPKNKEGVVVKPGRPKGSKENYQRELKQFPVCHDCKGVGCKKCNALGYINLKRKKK
jgi:hypothetical protein